MRPAAPHADATLRQLGALARRVRGLHAGTLDVACGDLVSAGWLGYASAAQRAANHAGCMARARGAMLDEIRAIAGQSLRRSELHVVSGDDALAVAARRGADDAPFERRPAYVRRIAALPSRVAALPSRMRAVVTALLAGERVPDIAARLCCTENAVYVSRHSAIKALSTPAH